MILLKASKKFVASIRKQDIVARVGGDEFVILFSNLQRDSELNNTIQKVEKQFFEPISINGITCPIGISIGISKCPEEGITTDELIKIADKKMYKDKKLKKTRREK